MTDHVFFENNATKNVRFLICIFKLALSPYGITTSNNCNNVVSPVFILYSSSFVVTLKNEIPGAALELCQLKLKQFSPDILKFSTKHEDNPFTLNCFMVPRTCLFIFDASSLRLGSSNSWNSSYKEKTDRLARVSSLSFRFLWLWLSIPNILHSVGERVDCVLLIVLVLLLSKHNYAPPNLNKKHCECFCCGVYMNLLMLL